jgi:L-lactate dehydrogenase complex protein LldG
MNARDEILARIRTALGTSREAAGEVSRTYRTRGEMDAGDPALITLLAERLSDYRAHVWRTTADDLATTVARALAHGYTATGDRTRARIVVPAGLPGEWLADADAEVVTDELLDTAALDDCDGVVTAAAVAIAETGTIVLDGAEGQGRRAITLVPDLHICVVHAEQVVATVPEGVAGLEPTRPLTWISGPSATSDIELERVEGVHGPRTLEVVLVEG